MVCPRSLPFQPDIKNKTKTSLQARSAQGPAPSPLQLLNTQEQALPCSQGRARGNAGGVLPSPGPHSSHSVSCKGEAASLALACLLSQTCWRQETRQTPSGAKEVTRGRGLRKTAPARRGHSSPVSQSRALLPTQVGLPTPTSKRNLR